MSFSSTNFSRFFVFRFTFFVLFTFAFSFFTVNYGQVKIKEKVEIKPTPNAKVKGYSSSNTSNFFPCGPFISDQNGELWQVVWLGSTYALDLEQQPYNYQRDQENQLNLSRFKYSPSIEILEGFEKCEFREVFKCDSITGECPDPISVNAGVKIMPESMFDITGKGDFTIIQGIPTRITSGYVRYTLRFIKEGDVTIGYTDPFDPETTIRFHTKVVKPDFYLEYTGLGVLPHGEEENDFDVSERPLQCVGFWADEYGLEFWNGGSLPENVKFNVEMLEGTEYAKLIHETFDGEFYNRDTSTSYTGLDGTNYELFLSALGKEPEDTAVVKLRYSTTDNNIPAIEQEVKIVKNPTYPIKVTLTPNELMPGDTAFISLDQRLDSYPYDPYNLEYEPFGTDQLFDIKIEKGSELGTIYSIAASDTSDEFKQLTDGFYFIAKEEINSANTEISIRVRTVVYYFDDLPVTTITAADKIAHAKKAKQNRTAIISIPTSSEDIFGIGRAEISQNEIEIMLGETKYFQAIYRDPTTNKLEIREVNVGTNGVPALEGGLAQNVWGTNPITIVNDSDTSGRRSGVYWETNKPVWDGLTNRGNLETGLIRVIGRYWHQDSSYVVKLKAGRNSDSAEVNIRVISPAMLGTEYQKVNNCFQERFNLDSTIIYYSGKFGIPPQIVKAQVHEESSFTPSMLYEPYKDIQYQANSTYSNDIRNNQYYILNANNEGTPISPNNHHIKYWGSWHDQYPGYLGTIYDVWKDHQNTYSLNIYNGMKVVWNNEVYNSAFREVQLLHPNVDSLTLSTIAADTANARWPSYLRNNYMGGMSNYHAQTRIWSSYGYLQMVYFFGTTDRGYSIDNDHLPEYLMLTDSTFLYGTKHLVGQFTHSSIREEYGSNTGWNRGYDNTFWRALRKYNNAAYANRVSNKIHLYLPRKNED